MEFKSNFIVKLLKFKFFSFKEDLAKEYEFKTFEKIKKRTDEKNKLMKKKNKDNNLKKKKNNYTDLEAMVKTDKKKLDSDCKMRKKKKVANNLLNNSKRIYKRSIDKYKITIDSLDKVIDYMTNSGFDFLLKNPFIV